MPQTAQSTIRTRILVYTAEIVNEIMFLKNSLSEQDIITLERLLRDKLFDIKKTLNLLANDKRAETKANAKP